MSDGFDTCDNHCYPYCRIKQLEKARKQVAREIIQYIIEQGIIEVGWNKQQVYEIDRSDIVELQQRYGLEG